MEPGTCKHKKKLHKHKNDIRSFHHTCSVRRSFSSHSASPLVSSVPLTSSTVTSVPSGLPYQDITSRIPADPPPPYTPTATPTNYPLYVNTFQTPGPGTYSSYIPFTHPSYVPYQKHLLVPQPVQPLNTLQALQSFQHQKQHNIQHLQQHQQMQQFRSTPFQPTQPYESSLLLQVVPNTFVPDAQSQNQRTESLLQNQNSISSQNLEQNQNWPFKSNLEQGQKITSSQSQQYSTFVQYPNQPSTQSFQKETSPTAVLKAEEFDASAHFDVTSKSIPPPPPRI